MSDRFVLATRRSIVMVNRVQELSRIKNAIYHPSAGCEIILLLGVGGLGKSRLVEEVLWCGGNPKARADRQATSEDSEDWDWTSSGLALFPDLLDMTGVDLHTHLVFLQALRDSLIRFDSSLDFYAYDMAYQAYQEVKSQEGPYSSMKERAGKVEEAFLASYWTAAERGRIVLTLDTVERLAYSHSSWLVKQGLVSQEELTFTTAQWLASQIQQGTFKNTTLILSGRPKEGENFFTLIREAVNNAQENGESCALDEIQLESFSLGDTVRFFELQANSWIADARANPDLDLIANAFTALANDPEQMEVLWLYTQGQPVRLSLYADLLIEGARVPERLLDTPQEAHQHVAEGMDKVQAQIEAEFINLLFGTLELRSEILTALVRVPRGMGPDQLCFALQPELPDRVLNPADPLDIIRLGEIEHELNELKRLSIVKIRPDGRLGLQDEIYTIYANSLAPQDPSPDQAEEIERRLRDERRARMKLYRRLHSWARHQRKENEEARSNYQVDDERRLVFQSPANAYAVHFPPLIERNQQDRADVRHQIQYWEQEELHYSLLVDLPKALNDTVFDLGYRKWIANDEEADFLNLEEVYQVLYDDALLRFIEIHPWKGLSTWNKTPIEAMRRFMRQAEVIRWIQRFVNRGDSNRFFQFYNEVENAIDHMSKTEHYLWNHTFSRNERRIWYDYAKIRWGKIEQALADLERCVHELESLASYPHDKLAFQDRSEYGFIGHPAQERLNKVIALGYNYLGYGYVTLGHLRKSVKSYSLSVKYMRNSGFRVHLATTLNNLSRALSDMGRGRARRVCLDGLTLRKEQGAEVPIAYSMNTLALIDNDMLRPDLSWVEAATAVAYFRRADDRRGLGLALIQLGEALRRMAALERTGRILPDPPELIFDEAERVLKEAVVIFSNEPEKSEIIRLIEARIEMGCLLRDRLLLPDLTTKDRSQTYANAKNVLNLAIRDAKERDYPRQRLDAEVNMAWAHYYAKEIDAALEAIEGAQQLIPEDALIHERGHPQADRDDSYIYQQLGKAYNLRGKIAMDRFRAQGEAIRERYTNDDRETRRKAVSEDPRAQKYLRLAAEYYVLGLAYAQLFSPRSSALTAMYDSLYEYLKSFNQAELEAFYHYEHQAREQYQTATIEMEDLGNLDEFLRECFGAIEEQ
ncbi:MAG: hypothetical protein VB089_05340 [Anaerolineaceae bacterium]|nr:hypothetical protein [Anaerolineaceae bacterium]